ncbi:unnamed protein product [Lactuca saligna]|uniref:Uncharacterized protein n=1 Tax=Lactuca saligna TaxID=75948 RepID=A0AA35YPK9_LACSI|nr:unnamed protein product [Lactuca saligna]
MSDKCLTRKIFPVGPLSGRRPSSLCDPSGLPCIPLTCGYAPGARSSPLSDPSGLPHNALISGFVSGARSSPLPDTSCLPNNIFTGNSVSTGRSSSALSGLQHNHFLVGSTPRARLNIGGIQMKKGEKSIREGFKNTLKDRFRDRMKDAREASPNSTRKVEHIIV